MKKTAEFIGFLFRALVLGLAIAFVIVYFWPSLANRGVENAHNVDNKPVQTPNTTTSPASYADAVNLAAPSVVSIYTSFLEPQNVSTNTQRRLGGRSLYRMRRDMGSGVLVSADGYILTNHHVISQAQNIKIALWDGRLANALVVGSDLETDLAVLKIDLTGLPVAPIANGYTPRVGDVVLAIGNALGLSHTVTMGIVSATGRINIGSQLFSGFIQTDAAINAGNSGGALVNALGELIGINTRNIGSVQGAQNIGFAIPMEIAQGVMQQIIDYGSVRRGWLGASFSDPRPSSSPSSNNRQSGISVQSVTQGGPAWTAGIREGDEILSLDGDPVDNSQAFDLSISSMQPGSQVELEVRRGQKIFETYATLIQQTPITN